jgi:hypothetical protein
LRFQPSFTFTDGAVGVVVVPPAGGTFTLVTPPASVVGALIFTDCGAGAAGCVWVVVVVVCSVTAGAAGCVVVVVCSVVVLSTIAILLS